MLSLLLLIPVIGSIILLFVSDNERMKKIALATSLLNLLLSIYMWVQFDSSTTQFQFVQSPSAISDIALNFYQFNIGVDGLSIYFVL